MNFFFLKYLIICFIAVCERYRYILWDKRSIHIRFNMCWVDWGYHLLTLWHLFTLIKKKPSVSLCYKFLFCAKLLQKLFLSLLRLISLITACLYPSAPSMPLSSCRTITHWSCISRFMSIALNTLGLLTVGGYQFSTAVNGVRWFSTFWSKSIWKHFAYVFFKVSIYTWVERSHKKLDFSRVPFVRLHLNTLCF